MAGPKSWFVAVVMGACALGAICALAGRIAARTRRVELSVQDLVHVRGGLSVLVLAERDGVRRLPVPLSKAEAALIDHAMHGPRGLVQASLEALGGRVLRASIDGVSRDRALKGHLTLSSGSREVRLEATAGEALALALQAGAPIVADPEVLDEAGISPDDLHGKNARSTRREVEPAPVLGI